MRSLKHLNKYFNKYRLRLGLGVLFIVISNLFAVYAPQVVREAFDLMEGAVESYNDEGAVSLEVPPMVGAISSALGLEAPFENGSLNKDALAPFILKLSLILAIIYLVIALLKGLFLFFTRQTIIIMSRLIEYDLKNDIFEHYQKLNIEFYKRNNTGDLMNRISEDVSRVRMYLGPAVMYTINLVVLFVLAITFMLKVNVELTLWVLTPLPILSVTIYYVSNIINKRSETVQKQQSLLSTIAQESFSGIRVIKAYGKEKSQQDLFDKESELYKVSSLSLVKVNALFMPAIILLIGLSTIMTIYFGSLKVIQGTDGFTIGNIAEFVIYVNMMTWPFAAVGWVTSLVQRAAASQERINEFLQMEPNIYNTASEEIPVDGKVEFKEVSFTYPDTGIEALKNVSFTIPKGKTLAIVGRTGSGKSTIAQLISRTYDVTTGDLLIDGIPIQDVDLNNLRKSIGSVPQDVFLFSDTISNNIAFGLDPEQVSDERITQAAKDAQVYDDIEHFEKGFETMLGERGINLSGGQKQRVSIARAIAREPKILIFDDCLSAVDTATEEALLRELERIMNDRTTLLIGHRVSTVKNADEIIVLENGTIAERGNHKTLLELGGIYASLHQKQLLEEQRVMD